MNPKVGMDRNAPFTPTGNSSNSQQKEQISNLGYTVESVPPVASSSSHGVLQDESSHHQTPLSARKPSSLDYRRSLVFKNIQETVIPKVGTVTEINQQRLVIEVTKKISKSLDFFFKNGEYHAFFREILEGTSIPYLIRAEKLIPIIMKGECENQLVVEFKDAPGAYVHTLNGQEVDLVTKPIIPFYDPQALNNTDSSMLRVRMGEFGFTDGSPRYIFTTGLRPCICLTLFDKSQNKVLLGHFVADEFSPERLSEAFKFCEHQKMSSIECHIVGGTYEDLGLKNGFLSLMDYISSKGIPIKQMFVGDTLNRPKAVVVDTKDMILYGLPFSTINYPLNPSERSISLKNVTRIANMPLLTKDHSLSLWTSSWSV